MWLGSLRNQTEFTTAVSSIPERGLSGLKPSTGGNFEGDSFSLIRVCSTHSGSVFIAIRGFLKKDLVVHFGLIPARLAECLGVITAAKLLLHHKGAGVVLRVSANNRDFVRYALRERVPRRREIRAAVEHMWAILEKFKRWEMRYKPSKRLQLKGSPSTSNFPKGAFPWVKAEVSRTDEGLVVVLPDCPAVRAQFRVSIRSAVPGERGFLVPYRAEKVLYAWLNAVRGGL